MPGRTKKSTGAAAERRLKKERRGEGEGANYVPGVLETDFPAHSTCYVITGWKHFRRYHLLSTHERNYFYVLEYCDDVVEIREGFLLDLERTSRIAQDLKQRHPQENGRMKKMSTDFLLFVRRGSEIRRFVRTAKLISGLWGSRVFSLLEIDRRYWQEEGVDWGIVTEADIPEVIWRNVDWIHESRYIFQLEPLTQDEIKFVAHHICETIDINSPVILASFCLNIDRALGSEHGTALRVAKFLLANKVLRIDITKPLDSFTPLPIIEVQSMEHLWHLDTQHS